MKNKILTTIVLAIIIVVTGYFNTGTVAVVKIQLDPIIVEYGELIDLNKTNFIQLDNIRFVKNNLNKTEEDIFDKINVDVSGMEYVDNAYYLTLDKHTIKLYVDNSEDNLSIYFDNMRGEYILHVEVQDTTRPQFVNFQDIVETYKDVPVNLVSLYHATDYDEVKITVDEKDLNYSKVGTYSIMVSAYDSSGNIESREATVVVKQPTIKLNKSSATIYLGNVLYLTAEINGKTREAKYSSSDGSIATVDANGKVVGKKAGTVVITATANGVSDTCKVTIKQEVVKTHKINASAIIDIGYYFDGYNSVNGENIYNTIVVNNSRKIYIKTTVAKFLNDFWAMTRYTNTGEMFGVEIPYTEAKALEDEGGKYLILNAEYFDVVKEVISNKQDAYSKHRKIYRDTIVSALKGMDLICTDREMVEQINDWICKKLSYKVTHGEHYEIFSVYNYKGQCYHYAMLFNDMCRAVGIKSSYITGYASEYHAWNSVVVNGTTYYFDVTWNDQGSYSSDAWSWMSKSEFSKTHHEQQIKLVKIIFYLDYYMD